MAFHTYKIEHFGKDTDGNYVSTATELSDIISISVNIGIGAKADSFSFTIVNYDDYRFENIKIDDRVKIYGKIGTADYQLLIDGIVNAKANSFTPDTKVVTYSGLNRLEKLFNSLVATTGERVQRPASYWIQNIIDQVNDFNDPEDKGNRLINYDATSITQLASTYNISYIRAYEKAFTLIDELSKPEYTDGKAYIYYLDENNKFWWKPRPEGTTDTINLGELLSHRTDKGMFDLVNYIIMNAGKSAYGATILQVGYDVESINKHGWKVKLVTRESLASELRNNDLKLMSDKGVRQDDSNFPSAYAPYITAWGASTTSDSDYNSKFVDKVLEDATDQISALLYTNTSAKHKLRAEMFPSFDFVSGENYELVLPSNYWDSGYILRLEDLNYNFNQNGWNLSLSFVEDEESARVAV